MTQSAVCMATKGLPNQIKIKLNPDNRYIFIDDDGQVITLDSLDPQSYLLENAETYIAVHILDNNYTVTNTHVLYVQATSKDML